MTEQITETPVQNSIYSFLKDNGLTSKSEADFNIEYADSAKAKELYGFFTENQLTGKDFDSFYKDNFSSVQAAQPEEQPLTYMQKELRDKGIVPKEGLPEGYSPIAELNKPTISPTESLHSTLPYVNVDKRQFVPSIQKPKEDVSFSENTSPKVGSESKM